uniref:Ubiquitin carboxyl-terminal hydrolase n=1 Tax=Chelonoidis abingdonii TaxID=106734 RepID=A0A8C0H4G0_CHEAB
MVRVGLRAVLQGAAVMAELSEALLSVLPAIRVPKAGDRVHKEECAFSFDTPESDGGLYICMNTFLGFGKQYVEKYYGKTGHRVYLHLKRTRKLVRMGCLELGDTLHCQTCSESEKRDPTPCSFRPEAFLHLKHNLVAIEAILTADSASRKQEVQAWDGEVRRVSKHAFSLNQLQNSVRIPPCGWKCNKCDMRENLWLNMTDGSILCGRRYFDGSGGNNHAVEHYRETGYPLAVKLGTITPDGADVYSYDEDDMVLDPSLAEHLAHFGIDMLKMQKVRGKLPIKTRGLSVTIAPVFPLRGSARAPLSGFQLPSCHLAWVVMRVSLPADWSILRLINLPEITPTLTWVLAVISLSDSAEGSRLWSQGMQAGIAPRMFKSLIGKGHPEFSTNRQQDAQEFFLHFINMVERNCRSSENPNEVFRFLVEEKLKCLATEKVKYTQRVDYIMQLPVPMDAALNKDELLEYEERKRQAEEEKQPLPELVRAKVPFSSCLEAYGAPEQVDDFWSTALQAKSVALKTTRFASFPDYLVIQIKKFTFGLDWVPKKLDVSIEMPEELDISALQGTGLQAGEEEMPDIAPPLVTPDEPKGTPMLDESVIIQLVEMGFPMDACRKAVYYTGNSGAEAAMNWIMSHMDDPDFANPLVLSGSSGPGSTIICPDPPSEDSVATIVSMGFSRDQAMKALRATSNSLERAVDWIFSHIDDLDAEAAMDISEGRSAAESISESVPVGPKVRDGPGKYQLFAFISHMGTSTMCGHYVCHIKKDGRWVIYNDQKVCASEKPPKDLGYIYFYQRILS